MGDTAQSSGIVEAAIADHPEQGFHFHTGRRLAHMLSYDDEWLDGKPADTLASFAGTGNPFRLGQLLLVSHVRR